MSDRGRNVWSNEIGAYLCVEASFIKSLQIQGYLFDKCARVFQVIFKVVVPRKHNVSPRVILLCLYREPQPQKKQKALHHRPQTPSAENFNPNTKSETITQKTRTPKPQ